MRKLSTAQVRKALENLPQGVDDTYDEAMERIERQDEDRKRLSQGVFSWVTHAFRPLSVRELQHALAVKCNMTDIDPEAIIDEEILTSVCAGLVIVDETQSIVRLVRMSPAVTQILCAYFSQTTQPNSTSNASGQFDFLTLRPPSLQHVLHTSHLMYLGTTRTATGILSWKTIPSSVMLLGTGATMHTDQWKRIAKI